MQRPDLGLKLFHVNMISKAMWSSETDFFQEKVIDSHPCQVCNGYQMYPLNGKVQIIQPFLSQSSVHELATITTKKQV